MFFDLIKRDSMSREHIRDGMTIDEGTLKLLTVMSFSSRHKCQLDFRHSRATSLTEPKNSRGNMCC